MVVSAALRWLATLDTAHRLADEEASGRMTDVMGNKVKGQPLAALRLLDSIRRRTPAADVRPAGRAALGHPHPDVQRKAAALLRAAGDEDALVGAADLDPAVRRELGLNAAGPSGAAPVQPVVDAPPEIVPVTDTDLPDRLAALLEDASDPIELELVLDRLARTTDPAVLAPLQKRAWARVRSGQADYDGDAWLAGQLARIVVGAVDGRMPLVDPSDQVARFLHDRLAEVSDVVAGRRLAGPLLATPDHGHGWISAEILLERVRAAGPSVRRIDLIAALLRLHPTGRESALQQADVPGEIGAVLRYALGGPDARPTDVVDHGLWVAASRARAPFDVDPVLVSAGLDAPGQGRPLGAELRLHHQFSGSDRYWESEVVVPGARSAGTVRDQPTAVRSADSRDSWQRHEFTWVPWTASVWPHDADHFLIGSLEHVRAGVAFGWPGSTGALRTLLGHPGRMGPLAAAALAFGLSAARWTTGCSRSTCSSRARPPAD